MATSFRDLVCLLWFSGASGCSCDQPVIFSRIFDYLESWSNMYDTILCPSAFLRFLRIFSVKPWFRPRVWKPWFSPEIHPVGHDGTITENEHISCLCKTSAVWHMLDLYTKLPRSWCLPLGAEPALSYRWHGPTPSKTTACQAWQELRKECSRGPSIRRWCTRALWPSYWGKPPYSWVGRLQAY